jgi:hypothetical protein
MYRERFNRDHYISVFFVRTIRSPMHAIRKIGCPKQLPPQRSDARLTNSPITLAGEQPGPRGKAGNTCQLE